MTTTLAAPTTARATKGAAPAKGATRPLDATFARAALTTGLALVAPALPQKTTLDVLKGIVVESVMADTGEGMRRYVRLAATDLSLAIRTLVPAELADDAEGAAFTSGAIPGKRLADLVRLLPPGAVRLVLSPTPTGAAKADVSVGRTHHRYDAHGADAVTMLTPATEGGQQVPARAFRAHAKRVLYAVGTDESRKPLTGVFLQAKARRFTLTATSGHRLGSVEFSVETSGAQGAGLSADLILPPRFLDAVLKSYSDDDTLTCYTNGEQSFTVTNGTTEITTTLIQGPYPDYARVIPKPESVAATLDVDRVALIGAVRRAMLVSEGKTHRVRLAVTRDLGGDLLNVGAALDGIGVGADELPVTFTVRHAGPGVVDVATGLAFEIGFNGAYLVDALTHLWTPTVRFSFTGTESAALIDCLATPDTTPAAAATDAEDGETVEPPTPTEADAKLVSLVMPLRLDPPAEAAADAAAATPAA